MNPDVLRLLAIMSKFPADPLEANTPELVKVTDEAFALGYLNICPPGWRYKLNDAGKAAVVEAVKAVAA